MDCAHDLFLPSAGKDLLRFADEVFLALYPLHRGCNFPVNPAAQFDVAGALGAEVLAHGRFLDAQQLSYVIERTGAEIEDLEKRRAQIDETLAELRIINAACRNKLEAQSQTTKA